MRSPHDFQHRGNATVIALIALVTALLALVIAFVALMQGGAVETREPGDRPAPIVQPPAEQNVPSAPSPSAQVIKPPTPSVTQPGEIEPAIVLEPEPAAPTNEPAPELETPAVANITPDKPTDMTATPSVTPAAESETPAPDNRSADGSADEPEPPAPPAPVAAAPDDPVVTPAGRSPIPAEGENITQPAPAERLVDEPTEPAPEGVIDWTEAKNHVGQEITARGTIVNTNNIGDLTFLNFDTDWQDKFYIVIFREAYADTPDSNPELAYLNKTIEVTGEVSTHKGRPQIQVRDASQIKVVE